MKGSVFPEVGNAEVLLHPQGARSETAVCDLRGRMGLFIGPGGQTDKRGKGPGFAPRLRVSLGEFQYQTNKSRIAYLPPRHAVRIGRVQDDVGP